MKSTIKLYADIPPLPKFEQNKDGSYVDKTDVKETLSKLMDVLGPLAPSQYQDEVENEEILFAKVEDGFSKILSGIKSSEMTPMERKMLITEANMILTEVKTKGGIQNVGAISPNKINVNIPKTSLYSDQAAPILLVYSLGGLGQATLTKLKSFGKAIQLKILDGESLTVMQESEINFAMKDAKTIIIAADAKKVETKKSWFGGGSDDEWQPLLNEKGLKRLLNAAMNEANKNGKNIKVVSVGKATKEPKSLSSMLGGDSTDFDAEVVLQCKKRGLGYGIIKVGNLIEDDVPLPSNLRDRSSKELKALTAEEEVFAQPIYESPLLFTSSRVEFTEVTRMSVAVDALLRSAGHPLMNSTTSVITSSDTIPTDAQWDDEFLRLDGPELARVPLRFASANQVALRLGRIVQDLKLSGSGLVTPIEVERYSNGARILFVPKDSTYASSKDEKNKKEQEAKNFPEKTILNKPRTQGYVSPEQEAENDRREEVKVEKEIVKSKILNSKVQLEGGLEVIVEDLPYRRVRIKRCNMGPKTIVKEESEGVLLKALLRGIQTLENDYRLTLSNALSSQ